MRLRRQGGVSWRPSPNDSQAGTGLIGSLFGVTVFLTLLLLAVQVTFDLYATSAVTSAASDAARTAAGARGDEAIATERMRHALGRYASSIRTVTWGGDAETVELRVVVDSPTVLPAFLAAPMGIDRVDRTVRARRESIR